jgi:hypothetical protein
MDRADPRVMHKASEYANIDSTYSARLKWSLPTSLSGSQEASTRRAKYSSTENVALKNRSALSRSDRAGVVEEQRAEEGAVGDEERLLGLALALSVDIECA